MNSTFAKGAACALAGATLWGFSGSCSQLLLEGSELDPSFITMARAVIAGVLFLGLLLATQREALRAMLTDRATLWRLVVFGIALFLSQFTYVESIGHTNAGTATVLQTLSIAITLALTCAFARRFPRAVECAALACALVGTFLIATKGHFGALALPATGLAWGLINAFSCSFYVMWPRRLFERWGGLVVTGAGMMFGAIVAVVFWVLRVLVLGAGVAAPDAGGMLSGAGTLVSAAGAGGMASSAGGMAPGAGALVSAAGAGGILPGAGTLLDMLPALGATEITVLLVIGVLGTFAAFGLYLYGVSVVGSVAGSMLGAVEPLSAMVFSAAWLGTVFVGADWIGFAFMVAMTFLVTKGGGASGGEGPEEFSAGEGDC